jgi:hypothetical protein
MIYFVSLWGAITQFIAPAKKVYNAYIFSLHVDPIIISFRYMFLYF